MSTTLKLRTTIRRAESDAEWCSWERCLFGSLVVRGDASPLTNNAIASLIAITFDRYRAFAMSRH